MVNAGRILIMAKGDWDNLTAYDMLDIVTGSNNIAYIARQSSVGVDPVTDTTKSYWQPFGATVSADGTTIVDDGNGNISVNLDGDTLVYDSNDNAIKVNIDGTTLVYDNILDVVKADVSMSEIADVNITSIQDKQILQYDSATNKFINANTSSSAGAVSYDNTSSGMSASTVQGAIDEIYKPTFSQAGARANINTGESIPTLFGKIKKWFNDLSVAIFSSTAFTVDTTSWTADTTSQSGTTLYKKSITVTNVYTDCPIVCIGGVLPSKAQQESFDLLQYVTYDGTTVNFYARKIPTTTFYVRIIGAN